MNELENIAIRLKDKCLYMEDPGLLYGQTGILIFLYHYGQLYNKEEYKSCIDDLFISIASKINYDTKQSYDDGIIGIFTGLLYLQTNHRNTVFRTGLLSWADRTVQDIVQWDISKINHHKKTINEDLRLNFIPCAEYLLLRISTEDAPSVFRTQIRLIFLLNTLERFARPKTPDETNRLFSLLWKISRLNICNNKIQRITRQITGNSDMDEAAVLKFLQEIYDTDIQYRLTRFQTSQDGLKEGIAGLGLSILSKKYGLSDAWLSLI